jgi:hypothetical protein
LGRAWLAKSVIGIDGATYRKWRHATRPIFVNVKKTLFPIVQELEFRDNDQTRSSSKILPEKVEKPHLRKDGRRSAHRGLFQETDDQLSWA